MAKIPADRSTRAPAPNATATTCAYSPSSLPVTVNRADRRPTVSARLMVNRTLGPGIAMRTIAKAANASRWLAGIMASSYYGEARLEGIGPCTLADRGGVLYVACPELVCQAVRGAPQVLAE